MRRTFLLFLGVVAITWLEYEFRPGHSYLQADTQIYLPILERLDTPGFLSRDLVATHPNVALTIYDEVTLFLHEAAQLDFRSALTAQQLLFRAAALLGVFLLALATGVGDLMAFLIAIVLNLGATLIGPDVLLVDREPLPGGFSFGLTLLAAGLIAREKPLLAALAGGLAVVYEPTIAAPLWAVLLVAFIVDRHLRRLLRPAITILIIFTLLLANLAQLQPGPVESQDFFSKISEPFAALQQYRTPSVWVRLWAAAEMWHYLAILVVGLWATARIWPTLKRQVRWLFIALPFCGIASVPVSDFLLDHLRWSIIPQIQPARALLYTVAFSSLACAIAGARAAMARKAFEASLWFVIVFALSMNVRILDLFRLGSSMHLFQLGSSILLACAFAWLSSRFANTKWQALTLLVPLAAIFVMPGYGPADRPPTVDRKTDPRTRELGRREHLGQFHVPFPRCRTRTLSWDISR